MPTPITQEQKDILDQLELEELASQEIESQDIEEMLEWEIERCTRELSAIRAERLNKLQTQFL